jgi:hypothetical protein
LQKLFRAVCTGTEIIETYHDLERLRLQSADPGKFDWAKLRPQAEIELFGTHKHLDKIHYACLSIDGNGLRSYGECTVQLAEQMIAHRTSCFEGNTAIIYKNSGDFENFIRCEWLDRNKICTAVLAGLLDKDTKEGDFLKILLEVGAKPEEDRFIELHIFGPMTAKTIESIQIDGSNYSRRDRTLLKAIREKLADTPITVT